MICNGTISLNFFTTFLLSVHQLQIPSPLSISTGTFRFRFRSLPDGVRQVLSRPCKQNKNMLIKFLQTRNTEAAAIYNQWTDMQWISI